MATRFALPKTQVFSDTGVPLSGAKLYFYASGTSTAKDTFSDAGLTVPNANPVVADAGGRFGDIFFDAGDYKAVLKTSADVSVWTADPVAGASSGGGSSTATSNLLINGDFRVFQRGGTSFADDAYCLDRWYALAQSGNVTVSQQFTQEAGQTANIRLTQPDASAKRLGLAQIVESSDTVMVAGSDVAFGARIRCSVSQPIRYAILAWTATSFDAVTSDVVLDWTSASYTAGGFFLASNLVVAAIVSITPAANVWTDLAPITALLSGAASNVIVMVWTEGTMAQNATLDIGLARLLSGETAGTFPVRPIGAEAALCLRYFYKTTQAITVQGSAAAAASAVYQTVPFPAAMRDTPTASTTFSSGGNNATWGISNLGSEFAQVRLAASSAGEFFITYDAGNTFDAEI